MLHGGFPERKTILLAGGAGTGKSILSTQFLIYGAENGENGVYVTFNETPEEIIENTKAFGWSLEKLTETNKIIFVDALPRDEYRIIERGPYDLSGLLTRIETAIKKNNSKRVVLDSVTSLIMSLQRKEVVRRDLNTLCGRLKQLDCTAILISELPEGAIGVSRYGVEEFVVDGIILLFFREFEMVRRRLIEIRKLRGSDHTIGKFPMEITDNGIVVRPIA